MPRWPSPGHRHTGATHRSACAFLAGLSSDDQAGEDLARRRRMLWPVLAAYVVAILVGLACRHRPPG